MTRNSSSPRSQTIKRVYHSRPERLLQALRVLLSDEEIKVLVEYVRDCHEFDGRQEMEKNEYSTWGEERVGLAAPQ